MKTCILSAAVLACCTFAASAAEGDHGKIKICRIALPGGDTGAIYLPDDGTYAASCNGDDACRSFVIGVTAPGTLKAGVNSCATLDAVVLKDDGLPITAGIALVAQWNTGSLESHINVSQNFR